MRKIREKYEINEKNMKLREINEEHQKAYIYKPFSNLSS